MKKILAILIVVSMLFSFTSCKSSDYKKAVSLYESGDYAEAINIFAELGDYKDSAKYLKSSNYKKAVSLYDSDNFAEAAAIFAELGDYEDSAKYLKDAKWFSLVKYLKLNGEYSDQYYILFKEFEGFYPSESYFCSIGVSSVNPDELYLSARKTEELSGSSYTCVLLTDRNSHEGLYYLDYETIIVSTYTKASAYGHVDLNTITSSTKLDCSSNASCENKDMYGRVTYDQDLEYHIGLLDNCQILLPYLLARCEEIFEETGLGITLADLGFTSYK